MIFNSLISVKLTSKSDTLFQMMAQAQHLHLKVSSLWRFCFIYHSPSGFLSPRKEEPLRELFPQTPASGYSWPCRTHVADKLVSPSCLGLPCRLVHSRGVHSVTLFVHLLSLNRAMCPAHPRIPFLITYIISFTPV